ncbi:putative vacuolar import and degradation protein [Clavispora lusitaniae]|uniref:Vacuolar import and degradation protein n=1 Tax=Clavispora lusitaniae TaxID=36911 RepID=A0AA91Q169_CLALS|nr:putative vacuolar import and degradation protein [Clavispora lusitaniae]
MNFLKRFLRASPTDELASIPLGKLFLSRSPLSPKGELECLYNDACISIKETTTKYLFQLTVVRAYQEGESISQSSDDYSDEDDGNEGLSEEFRSKDEKSFYLTQDLNARMYTKHDGTRVISWKDLHGDLGDKFEFFIDEDIRASDVDHFLFTLFRCMYEQKYQKSSDEIRSINELSEFFYDSKKDFDERASSFTSWDNFRSSLEMYNRGSREVHDEDDEEEEEDEEDGDVDDDNNDNDDDEEEAIAGGIADEEDNDEGVVEDNEEEYYDALDTRG